MTNTPDTIVSAALTRISAEAHTRGIVFAWKRDAIGWFCRETFQATAEAEAWWLDWHDGLAAPIALDEIQCLVGELEADLKALSVLCTEGYAVDVRGLHIALSTLQNLQGAMMEDRASADRLAA